MVGHVSLMSGTSKKSEYLSIYPKTPVFLTDTAEPEYKTLDFDIYGDRKKEEQKKEEQKKEVPHLIIVFHTLHTTDIIREFKKRKVSYKVKPVNQNHTNCCTATLEILEKCSEHLEPDRQSLGSNISGSATESGYPTGSASSFGYSAESVSTLTSISSAVSAATSAITPIFPVIPSNVAEFATALHRKEQKHLLEHLEKEEVRFLDWIDPGYLHDEEVDAYFHLSQNLENDLPQQQENDIGERTRAKELRLKRLYEEEARLEQSIAEKTAELRLLKERKEVELKLLKENKEAEFKLLREEENAMREGFT
eukprot:848756-Amorphochlora_amoeboformis.AAC.1